MAAPYGPITHLTRQRCTMQKEGVGGVGRVGHKVGRRVRRKKEKILGPIWPSVGALEHKIKSGCTQSAVATKT